MKQKIIMKLLAACACFLGVILLDGLFVEMLIEKRSDVVTVCIASHDIAPRTKITEKDIAEIQVAAAYIEAKAYTSKEEIIGKYTEIQGMIPAGSPFYFTMLKEENELPDFASLQLKKGQASFILEIDSAIANCFSAGQRVDVYYVGEVSGILFEHARIIALRDKNGYSVLDSDSNKNAEKIEIAVSRSDTTILETALQNGCITFHASNDTYDTEKEALLISDSNVVRYLQKEAYN